MRVGVSLMLLVLGHQAKSELQIPSCPQGTQECINNEGHARAYVDLLHYEFVKRYYKASLAEWAYATNITDETAKVKEDVNLEYSKYAKNVSKTLKTFDWASFKDKALKRLAKYYYTQGSAVDDEMLKRSNELSTKLSAGYSTAKVCKFEERDDPNCEKKVPLDPDLTATFRNSRNPEELKYYWQEWRTATGNPMKENYFEYQQLKKAEAISTGYKDRQDEWLDDYELDDVPAMMYEAWTKEFDIGGEQISLEGLYKQLHAFVRSKLAEEYKSKGVDIKPDGCVPAHLFGNMWAQSWGNIEDLVTPYPDSAPVNITPALIEQKIDAKQIFRISEEFFVQLGFDPMTDVFWNETLFEKPEDRDVICHASAWDMMGEDDFRVKMCTAINQEDFVTVHHEMGHIAYYQQYKDQPFPYRSGANPGFHEAVGDTMSLAVNTPVHLQKLGLLDEQSASGSPHDLGDGTTIKRNELNYLMQVGLEKIAFLPFALVIDSWRWNYFNGSTPEPELNDMWWQLRNNLQGVDPPVARVAENLDPLGKFHVPGDTPYIRYYFSFIAQFQFYEALCKKSGEYDPKDPDSKPLYLCDYSSGGEETGALFRDMLVKGASQHWELSMREVTGKTDLSGESIVRYFLPLYKYLKQQNAENTIGWKQCYSES